MNAIIREVEKTQIKETQDFRVGDSVRVSMEIIEGDKKRIQIYEGVIVAKKGAGINATVTVRKTTAGIGIEKIIPIHLPSVKSIEVVRRGKVRRAKLYYLRSLTGKATRVKEDLESQKSDRAVSAPKA